MGACGISNIPEYLCADDIKRIPSVGSHQPLVPSLINCAGAPNSWCLLWYSTLSMIHRVLFIKQSNFTTRSYITTAVVNTQNETYIECVKYPFIGTWGIHLYADTRITVTNQLIHTFYESGFLHTCILCNWIDADNQNFVDITQYPLGAYRKSN